MIFVENFPSFQYFSFEKNYRKTKTFSKNWSAEIATFLYKTTMSEANVETIIYFIWSVFMIWKNCIYISYWKTKDKKCKNVFSEQIWGRHHMMYLLIQTYKLHLQILPNHWFIFSLNFMKLVSASVLGVNSKYEDLTFSNFYHHIWLPFEYLLVYCF